MSILPGRTPITAEQVTLDLGWGRLVFGQTFRDAQALAAVLRTEELGQRDICIYHPEPHVLVSQAPHELFVDPSHTYRRWLVDGEVDDTPAPGVVVRPMEARDIDTVNHIYLRSGMVT